MLNNRLNETVIGTAKVIVDILPKGYGIPNTKITPTSITIHNTDNWDTSAKNNHKYMSNINKSGERKASWHFTVDDIEIYQAQSTNYKCLHAGDTTGNNTSIGIEICQFRDKNKQLKAYKNAIELIKILLKYHSFSIDKVVQHNKWSGKNCPSVLRAGTYGYNWSWLINEIKTEGVKLLELLILYGNDVDRVGAEIINWSKNATIKHIDQHKCWEASNLIVVGGVADKIMKDKFKDEKYTLISGIDRYDTVKKTLNYIGK